MKARHSDRTYNYPQTSLPSQGLSRAILPAMPMSPVFERAQTGETPEAPLHKWVDGHPSIHQRLLKRSIVDNELGLGKIFRQASRSAGRVSPSANNDAAMMESIELV